MLKEINARHFLRPARVLGGFGLVFALVCVAVPFPAFAQGQTSDIAAGTSSSAVSLFLLAIGIVAIGIVAARVIDIRSLGTRLSSSAPSDEDSLVEDNQSTQR